MSFRALGLRTWLIQRLSAVYIALYMAVILLWLLSHLPASYSQWSGMFSHPVMLIATAIFYSAVFVHAWVGIRDILIDYINPTGIRFGLLTLLALFLMVMSMWVLFIVIGLVKL